jgi:hypothetical protein
MRSSSFFLVSGVDEFVRRSTETAAHDLTPGGFHCKDLSSNEDVADLRILVDEVSDSHGADVSTRAAMEPAIYQPTKKESPSFRSANYPVGKRCY